MKLEKYSGIFMFEDKNDPDHLYRAGLRTPEIELLNKIKDLPFLIDWEDTGEVYTVGPRKDRPVWRVKRFPFEIRLQELTKMQAKKLLVDLADFYIKCMERGVCAWDLSESNIIYWDGKATFVDLDAFSEVTNKQRGPTYSYVKLAYLYNRYLKDNMAIKSSVDASHVTIRKYKDWTSKNWDGDHTDIAKWKEFKKVIQNTKVAEAPKTHWSEEYARDEAKLKDNEKLKIVLPFIERTHGGTLLDVGSNKGYYCDILKPHYDKLVGFDIDERCVDVAEKRYGNDKCAFSKISIDQLFAGSRDTDSRLERYKADTVMILAVTHHLHTCNIDPKKSALAFATLANKWIVIEDIERVRVYDETFTENGFKRVDKVASTPRGRSFSLWERQEVRT